MATKSKFEIVSIIITSAVAAIGLALGIWFYFVVLKDFPQDSNQKPLELKIGSYDKIVNGSPDNKQSVIDNTGRDNPFTPAR